MPLTKAGRTKALYAGSFAPVTRGHLDIIRKALMTIDSVHVAVGTNVRKQRMFSVEQSTDLIQRSLLDLWPEAEAILGETLEVGEYARQSLVRYARTIGATHIVRGLREATNFNEEFNLHGLAERLDASIPMVHFICDAQFPHVSSSTAKELESVGEEIDWLVTPSVEAASSGRLYAVIALASKRPAKPPRPPIISGRLAFSTQTFISSMALSAASMLTPASA